MIQTTTAIPDTAPSQPGIIYVGRTEGEMPIVLGKVGYVQTQDLLEGRVNSYKTADRIFKFELEAAFAVELEKSQSIFSIEQYVHRKLRSHGRTSFGENFLAPDGSMLLLVREVELALTSLGQRFVRLDTSELQEQAVRHNQKVWKTLRKGRTNSEPCPYEAWLSKESEPFMGLVRAWRPRQYAREVMAVGYLLRDLAAGSGLTSLEMSLVQGGNVTIYPSTLEAAMFEAKAEVDLALPTTTRFNAVPKRVEALPESPLAMRLILGQNLETVEVSNVFLPPTKALSEGVRFAPEHVAALGFMGKYGGGCRWEGLGVRAQIPAEVFAALRADANYLPGVRFWLGVLHCLKRDFRIQDLELPESCGPLWETLPNAALLLGELGIPVPVELQSWVAHAWFPAFTK